MNAEPEQIEERSRAIAAAHDLAQVHEAARQLRRRLDEATVLARRDLNEVDWPATRVRLATLERLARWIEGEVGQMIGSLDRPYAVREEVQWRAARSVDLDAEGDHGGGA